MHKTTKTQYNNEIKSTYNATRNEQQQHPDYEKFFDAMEKALETHVPQRTAIRNRRGLSQHTKTLLENRQLGLNEANAESLKSLNE